MGKQMARHMFGEGTEDRKQAVQIDSKTQTKKMDLTLKEEKLQRKS